MLQKNDRSNQKMLFCTLCALRNVKSTAVALILFSLLPLSTSFAAGLNCEKYEGLAKSDLNYKHRDNGERCEGMLSKLLSANSGSYFHVKSAVYGQVDYDLDSDMRLFVKTEINDASVKGKLELIGESLNVNLHYRLYSQIDPNSTFSWSNSDVIRQQQLADDEFGILARVHGSNIAGGLRAGSDKYLYVPVVFYNENTKPNTDSLNVTLVSANNISDVEIFDDCKAANPELIVSTDYIYANEPILLKLNSDNCDSTNVTVHLPSANNNAGEKQVFSILR